MDKPICPKFLTVLSSTPCKIDVFDYIGDMRESKAAQGYRDAASEDLLSWLKALGRADKTIFGMANATTIGYHSLHDQAIDSSDCKDITGSNPGFIEDDFMWFEGAGPGWDPEMQRNRHLEALRLAHEAGSVCGFCWHLRGKDSGSFRLRVEHGTRSGELDRDANLARQIVREIREYRQGGPIGSSLAWLTGKIDRMVIPVFNELGFPLVFRPFHEMNGAWFWWGSESICAEEYITLYRFTVDWIRGRGVKNILYAWSPNTPFCADYYPGDEWVDIVGLDSYEPGAVPWNDLKTFEEDLHNLDALAKRHDKVAAICETGCRMEGYTHRYPDIVPRFWTDCVLKGIDQSGAKIGWVMSWYQIDYSRRDKSQCYIPYRGMDRAMQGGKEAIEDFANFAASPRMILQDDLAKNGKKIQGISEIGHF